MSEIIILNARILPMSESGRRAEAVAIARGNIVAVGDTKDIGTLATSSTQTIDAGGRMVLPGFVESHMHVFPGSQGLRCLQAGRIEGFEPLKAALLQFSDDNPDETLLIVQGVNYTVLGADRPITRREIDAMLPDRPVFFHAPDYHNGWANTAALERAGLLHGATLKNAEVELNSDGLATGFLKEFSALMPVMSLRRFGGRENLGIDAVEPESLSAEDRAYDKQILLEGLRHAAAFGITTMINMDGNRYQLELLSELEADGVLPCRIEVPYHFIPGSPLDNLDTAEAFRRDFASDKIWSRRIKLFMDGVLDAGTALRTEDYPGQPGNRGERLHSSEAFAAVVTEADRRGFQIAVHAIGEGAVSAVLDGYAAARAANGVREARHRVEHIEIILADDIARMRDLGVIASVQPPHCPGNGAFPREPTTTLIGEANWPRAYAWRTLSEAGIPICFSSDWPVAPLSPLMGIHWATTRVPWRKDLKDERLSVEDTLHAYTAGGAYAAHCEHRFGTLEPGKAADLVMLSTNEKPEAVDWATAVVDLTIMDGRITFVRNP